MTFQVISCCLPPSSLPSAPANHSCIFLFGIFNYLYLPLFNIVINPVKIPPIPHS